MAKNVYYCVVFCATLTSCSAKTKKVDSPLFDNSNKSVSEDSKSLKMVPQNEVFKVLEDSRKQQAAISLAAAEAAKASLQGERISSEEFIVYTAVGREKLVYVGRRLLGSPAKLSMLRQWNPSLTGDSLSRGATVRVRKDALKPEFTFLPKGFVIEYKNELARTLSPKQGLKTYEVGAGDTLQAISKKNYQTTKRWIEIFLTNLDKIDHPDSLGVGINLKLR